MKPRVTRYFEMPDGSKSFRSSSTDAPTFNRRIFGRIGNLMGFEYSLCSVPCGAPVISSADVFENAMPEYDITRKSRPIVISEYDPQWAAEFKYLAQRIRGLVGLDATACAQTCRTG